MSESCPTVCTTCSLLFFFSVFCHVFYVGFLCSFLRNVGLDSECEYPLQR
uniref:Uncharacterized protein n=1 Tax=Anguilla anguilla TaxID=7936 RepID=A0A0E9PBP1_ANGAN